MDWSACLEKKRTELVNTGQKMVFDQICMYAILEVKQKIIHHVGSSNIHYALIELSITIRVRGSYTCPFLKVESK